MAVRQPFQADSGVRPGRGSREAFNVGIGGLCEPRQPTHEQADWRSCQAGKPDVQKLRADEHVWTNLGEFEAFCPRCRCARMGRKSTKPNGRPVPPGQGAVACSWNRKELRSMSMYGRNSRNLTSSADGGEEQVWREQVRNLLQDGRADDAESRRAGIPAETVGIVRG